jgi:hypothetical protein
MARKFRIEHRRSAGNLHVRLHGEFDGMCAWELIKTIRWQSPGAFRVFVDTAGLGRISDAGAELFKDLMTRKPLPKDWLYFKGMRAKSIAPEGSRLIVCKMPVDTRRKTRFPKNP